VTGDEVEVERGGRGPYAESGIGLSGGDGQGDLEVRVRFGSGQRVGRDARLGQQLVEQHAGPRTEWAHGGPQAAQVGGPADMIGVAGRCQQALLAAPQVDHGGLLPA